VDAPASDAAPITELQKVDVVKGSGEGISSGQQAVVHYTGWLYDPSAPEHKGKQFDSSRQSGRPFRFVIGSGGVIKGWDEGVQGMQPGGQRQLVIPADLGYGATGAGGGQIPPNATLLFDIELLAIEDAPPPPAP
jgi:FKBP-type peptidyl-prolyl cis-trans isomerase